MKFQYLGENLVVVILKLPFLVIDLDNMQLTQILSHDFFKTGVWFFGESSFVKINGINYWYDFDTILKELVS